MSFFDLYLYHPHHFIAEDIVRLFPNYRLKKQKDISEIYHDCPFRKRRRIKIYRLDKLVARIWQMSGEWGRGKSILFTAKLFICFSLAFSIALLRGREKPIYPFTKTWLFIFQKQ
jgi:hypothetical protein